MKITYLNSQEIAERIGKILNKPVNIMDENGRIVASTDVSRIGDIHTGAKELIEKNAYEIDIYPGDDLEGSKNGINVPIHIGGKTIGVIGVTGNPDELRDISIVIGEMAGIMYMKTEESLQNENIARQKRIFCEELLFSPPQPSNAMAISVFQDRAYELRFPINRIKAVGVFTLKDVISGAEQLSIDDKLISMLRGKLGDSIYIHHHYVGQKLIVFFDFNRDSFAVEAINDIVSQLSEQSDSDIYCGLSLGINSFVNVHQAYLNAEKAALIAAKRRYRKIQIYEDLSLEIILTQIPQDAVNTFVANIFKGMSREAIKDTVDFLNIYFEENGSLDGIAKKIFIHKNTVQYKIKKVIDCTGYDPRKAEDGLVLLLACKLAARMF